MDNLLIFFALPIATIILASVLEKLLNSPLAVAATAFAIYLIVTFAAFDSTFLIATIVYTILAFLSAVITRWICEFLSEEDEQDSNNGNNCNNSGNANNNGSCRCRRR